MTRAATKPSTPASVAAVQASIATGAAHVQAERTNQLDSIMATIGRQPYFPLLDHDGAAGLVLNVVTTTDEARKYYGERGTTYDIVDSRHVLAVASDWYTFRESVATLRHTGQVGGVAGHGELFQVNSAVLFPTGADASPARSCGPATRSATSSAARSRLPHPCLVPLTSRPARCATPRYTTASWLD